MYSFPWDQLMGTPSLKTETVNKMYHSIAKEIFIKILMLQLKNQSTMNVQ